MIVAELVMLVATVLIPAAKMEAINNPGKSGRKRMYNKIGKDRVPLDPCRKQFRKRLVICIQCRTYHKEHCRNRNKQITSEESGELSLFITLCRQITLYVVLINTIIL